MANSKNSLQTRGVERRAKLVAACRQLLLDHAVGQFGLAEVGAVAGVPKTSIYHFFPHIDDLLAALASEVASELLTALGAPFAGEFASWSDCVRAFVERGRDFYRNARPAMVLQLGPHTPPDIKNRDRNNDYAIGLALKALIAERFALPDLPDLDGAFFRAIEIADLMFMLSVRDHGELTEFYVEEAARAAVAYLEIYLPRILPRS
jgi:AcrR family transcriptional regulator